MDIEIINNQPPRRYYSYGVSWIILCPLCNRIKYSNSLVHLLSCWVYFIMVVVMMTITNNIINYIYIY